jgi:hypothetical protein
MFGKAITDKSVLYWGARAIYKGYSNKYLIELLWDRQSNQGFENTSKQDQDAFMEWINNRAVVWLRSEVKRRSLATDKAEEIVFREWKYELRANTNGSYGYLYIGVIQHEIEELEPIKGSKTERVFQIGDIKYVWGSDDDPPLVGTKGNVVVNSLGKGKVVGYFTEKYKENQLLSLQVCLENPPDWWVNQTTNDAIQKAIAGGSLKVKGTKPLVKDLKEWKKSFVLPPCIVWDCDFKKAA